MAWAAAVGGFLSTYGGAIAAGVAVAGTAYSIHEQQKQAAAQRDALRSRQKAAKQKRKMAALKRSSQRRQLIAESRIKQGALRNQAAVSGAIGSSGAAGGQAGLASDTANALAMAGQLSAWNDQALSFLSDASGSQAKAARYGSRAQLGSNIAGLASPYASFSNIGRNSVTTPNTAPSSYRASNGGQSFALPTPGQSISVSRL